MSTALACNIQLKGGVVVQYTGTDGGFPDTWKFGTGLLPAWALQLTYGTTANKAQKHAHKKITIAGGGNTTIDLTAFASDNLGTISLSNVRAVIIRLRSPATGVYVTVGNASSNVFAMNLSSSTVTFNVADMELKTSPIDGWTVDSTHKNVKIANPGGASVDIDVSFIGY
jgi:hypothetical protein